MPEQVRVLLPAHLRHYNDGDEELALPWVEGATLAHYLEVLGIPEHEFMGIVLDGELSADRTRVPDSGSTIELVPAMSGG